MQYANRPSPEISNNGDKLVQPENVVILIALQQAIHYLKYAYGK